MVQIFVKRFYGFDPYKWPVVSFSRKGDLVALIGNYNPGDLLVFIGTRTGDTEPDDKGRLLGMVTLDNQPLDNVLDHIDPSLLENIPGDALKKDGSARWPHAVRILEAWEFPDKPDSDLIKETLSNPKHNPKNPSAVLLEKRDRDAVLALQKTKIPVRPTP